MNLHDPSRTQKRGTPLDKASSAVILIHGRGANAEDIAGLANYLPANGLAVLAPEAQQNTWYPQRFFVPLQENEPWLSSGLQLVDRLVKEIHEAGIPYEKIGIAGFSQGGCLALEYAMRNPRRYGFVAGMSSALIGPLKTRRAPADLEGTPVLIACAENDAHIPLPFVEESSGILESAGADVTKQIFRGYDHTVFPEEIQWLADRIGAWNPLA
jgi:phospholipase/carboxylesterase